LIVKIIDFLSVLPFSLRILGNRRIGVAHFLATAGETIPEILLRMANFGSESGTEGAKLIKSLTYRENVALLFFV
jgi:hypothetical protein